MVSECLERLSAEMGEEWGEERNPQEKMGDSDHLWKEEKSVERSGGY